MITLWIYGKYYNINSCVTSNVGLFGLDITKAVYVSVHVIEILSLASSFSFCVSYRQVLTVCRQQEQFQHGTVQF